jgi:H+/Cl- antiporter ClcA
VHAISAVAESCRAVRVLQIGAAAFMAGATRMTLTTTVMVMETTGAMQLIVPLMITVFVAKVRRRPP